MHCNAFILLALFLSFFNLPILSYDLNQANVNVWLSAAAYCDKESYYTMKLAGPASGFIVKEILYDKKTDVEGYIGILPSTKTIHVVIRGSSSVRNWIDDFIVVKTPYITFPECDCEVHEGFYMATLSLSNITISTVLKLLYENPTYNVICTGHSLAASIGALLALELKTFGIESSVYNYGQPRLGDQQFSTFLNTQLLHYWRFTHDNDIVPHVPPMKMKYIHSCGEVFENESGELRECSLTDCEDITCADKYSALDVNSDAHSVYLGHFMSCNTSTIM